ncbi:hypothetical protein MNBD_PLANCTO02-1501 [hydrothermal vent metagenome]|uniref:Sodium/bile acid symporter family n=1 Tax=hydrothermal vent metagenome TaxID=652676 RepID=A0A3B1DR00_9ZZZZ
MASKKVFMMQQIITKYWFLICLTFFTACGLFLGLRLPADELDSLIKAIDKRLLVGLVLFLMSFTLDSQQLLKSVKFPLPVFWACLVNMVFIPLLGWLMMPLQLTVDFRYGLMIAASVPCTMAAASVWTRKAEGNDAISLMVTLLTNGFCFLITPFWLEWTTSRQLSVSTGELMSRLVVTALLPMVLGQLLRQPAKLKQLAVNRKIAIGVIAQWGVLVIVFVAGCTAGRQLNGSGTVPAFNAILLVWGSVVVIHLAAMGVGYAGSRLMQFSNADQRAILFASSQKTLPIGLLIATSASMFGDPNLLGEGKGIPFALFPMLLYHASQLFIDTLIANKVSKK